MKIIVVLDIQDSEDANISDFDNNEIIEAAKFEIGSFYIHVDSPHDFEKEIPFQVSVEEVLIANSTIQIQADNNTLGIIL